MLSELVTAGRSLFNAGRPNSGRTKNRSLIQTLTSAESIAYHQSQNGSAPTLLSPEREQDVVEMAQTALQPLRDHLNGFWNDTYRKQTKLVSVLALSPKEDKADTPVRQSSALNLMTQHSFHLSQIALGLAVAGFFFKPLAILSLVFVVLGAPEIVRRSYDQLTRERRTTVDLLILATVFVGVVLGAGTILTGNAIFSFMLSLNVFLANYAQRLMRQVREDAKSSLVDVFKQQPSSVWVMVGGIEVEAPVESLRVGDIIVVNAGETIAIDGRIVEGLASVDQHILTGEAQPAEKGAGGSGLCPDDGGRGQDSDFGRKDR